MVTEVQWSELQRDPKEVAKLADAGAVRVRRRDGAPLLLVQEDRAQAANQGAISAARAVRGIFDHLSPEAATTALRSEFPWMDVLPTQSIPRFVEDFVRAFAAASELGQWTLLEQTVQEWRSTAAIYADPTLSEQLSGPIEGDFGPVPTPMEE